MNLRRLLIELKIFYHKSETPPFGEESRRTNVHLLLEYISNENKSQANQQKRVKSRQH